MNTDTDKDRNPDPITGAPGSHPIGTGVGAAGAGAAGAAIGAVGGPVGAVIGGAIGAVAGGLAGKGVAEMVDPTEEDAYWRENHRNQEYARDDVDYDDYAPAYSTGYTGYNKYQGRTWDDVEGDLANDYQTTRGNSRLEWNDAKHATRAAWHKVERAIPGDADRDGR